MKAYIVPGYQGRPDEHWFPQCLQILRKIGVDANVHVPANTHKPVLNDQREKLQRELNASGEEKILIAHSLGAWLVLHMLLEVRDDVRMVILVSGAAGELPHLDHEILNDIDPAFYAHDAADFSDLRTKYYFSMFHGTDDQIVPLENAEYLASFLCVEIHRIEGGGHLNQDTLDKHPEKIEELLAGIAEEIQTLLE